MSHKDSLRIKTAIITDNSKEIENWLIQTNHLTKLAIIHEFFYKEKGDLRFLDIFIHLFKQSFLFLDAWFLFGFGNIYLYYPT